MAVFLLAGCNDDSGSNSDAATGTPREVVDDPRTLLVGEIVEGTFHGGPSDSVKITLSVPVAKLDWNLHGHAGGGHDMVHEELAVMQSSYTFVPTATADWNLTIRNKDSAPLPVQVHLELFGAMTWSGWP
jgi:hypothetical protein